MVEEKKLRTKHSSGIKIAVGFFLICAGFIITGNGAFLAMSIICTAGISLVAYIPLSIIVGHLFFMVWDRIFNKQSIIEEKEFKTFQTNNNQKALVSYITQARAQGISDKQIVDNLRSQGGWLDDDISIAFKSISK